ncbi:MAG: AAA family ATPase [Nitrosomonas sp.]|jgi:hypothetical protein|nr:AAA family ATPase [Nitrosomonas sp.]
MSNDSSILEYIAEHYLSSHDFNGLPVRTLREAYSLTKDTSLQLVERRLRSQDIDVMFGNIHVNPHIKAFSHITHEKQLEFLAELGLEDSHCLYPSAKYLSSLKLESRFEGRPYDLELALGAGQLDFRVFDLLVLEYYRNDPRYYYKTNFIDGSISITDEHCETGSMPEKDQVLLQTFGFAYDDDLNRGVAVFLRYLKGLSPEHQRIWHARQLSGDYKLHPDYYRNSILGDSGTRISIFEALPLELKVINEMSALIGKAPLFRQTFEINRPKNFGFLLRPTLSEFNDFILLLDKMLSDNINKDFFKNDTDLEEERERADGKIEVKQKGTLALLEEWLRKRFTPKEPAPFDSMFKSLKEVRRLRQKPAHAVNEDVFNLKYFKEQRQLVIGAYDAVRTLRLALANHPAVRRNPPEIQKNLERGEIWDI